MGLFFGCLALAAAVGFAWWLIVYDPLGRAYEKADRDTYIYRPNLW